MPFKALVWTPGTDIWLEKWVIMECKLIKLEEKQKGKECGDILYNSRALIKRQQYKSQEIIMTLDKHKQGPYLEQSFKLYCIIHNKKYCGTPQRGDIERNQKCLQPVHILFAHKNQGYWIFELCTNGDLICSQLTWCHNKMELVDMDPRVLSCWVVTPRLQWRGPWIEL